MTLPDVGKLTSSTARTSGLSSSSVANDAGAVGSEIDNSTNLDRYADIELEWTYGTTPTADHNLYIFLIHAIDGTNYEDGSASVQPTSGPVLAAEANADTSTHRKTVCGVPLSPHKFKILVWNSGTGQTASVTVTINTYNDSIVD